MMGLKVLITLFGIFSLGDGDDTTQSRLRFGIQRTGLSFSGLYLSYCAGINPSPGPYADAWNQILGTIYLSAEMQYWSWTVDYTDITELSESKYEGYTYYPMKLYVNGELVIDSYINTNNVDAVLTYFKNLENSYFELGRCSMTSDGFWHYADASVKMCRVYGRALTIDEVKDNYDATIAYIAASE